MIVSFKHKGLEQFFLKGDASKLPATQLGKIRLILATLHAAETIDDIRVPGFDLHPLKGDLKSFWSVKVNGNYRIIFQFQQAKIEVIDVNYLDYH
ncbi:MAG: type II toxin-antitoxin system RelE/ParE family toxin [Bacteroidota bacterium]